MSIRRIERVNTAERARQYAVLGEAVLQRVQQSIFTKVFLNNKKGLQILICKPFLYLYVLISGSWGIRTPGTEIRTAV